MSCVAQPVMAQTLLSMRSRRFEAYTKSMTEYKNKKGSKRLTGVKILKDMFLLHKQLF